MELLLHACCGPCSVPVARELEVSGLQVTSFYYNPNIQPFTEYKARLDSLKKLVESCPSRGIIVSDRYDMEEFLRRVAPDPTRRCQECYTMRLSETARAAREGGFDLFSSTLLVSPYQDHELLRAVGERVATEEGVCFLYRDFRLSFRKGQEDAKAMGLYRQKYCGCVYSEMERYLKRKAQ